MWKWKWRNLYSLSDPLELTNLDETERAGNPEFRLFLSVLLLFNKLDLGTRSDLKTRHIALAPLSPSEEMANDWSSGCLNLVGARSLYDPFRFYAHVLPDVKERRNHPFITGPGLTLWQWGRYVAHGASPVSSGWYQEENPWTLSRKVRLIAGYIETCTAS